MKLVLLRYLHVQFVFVLVILQINKEQDVCLRPSQMVKWRVSLAGTPAENPKTPHLVELRVTFGRFTSLISNCLIY